VTWWTDKPLIRVSFQGYNTQDDLEALMAALENLLPEMTPAVSAGITAPA
jgi:selenocysteine lyase/cysteine desulfurase